MKMLIFQLFIVLYRTLLLYFIGRNWRSGRAPLESEGGGEAGQDDLSGDLVQPAASPRLSQVRP
jgi:hypothetical protein